MRRIIFRNTLIPASMAVALLSAVPAAAGPSGEPASGHYPAAEQGQSPARAADIARAREELVDLLVSERIDRIDFQAETYEQAMEHIHIAIDAVLVPNLSDYQDITLLTDHARQVIEALNATQPRGEALTFGATAKSLPVRSPAEARALGEVVGNSVSLIRDQFGKQNVSYRDRAGGLFRSVILDADEGPTLSQYLDVIELITDLPPAQRARFFQ